MELFVFQVVLENARLWYKNRRPNAPETERYHDPTLLWLIVDSDEGLTLETSVVNLHYQLRR